MAKESGLAITTLTIDDSAGAGQDLRNDITSFNLSTPRALQDVTGIDKSAMERLTLLADGQLGLTGVFNDVATKSHVVFKNFDTLAASQVGRTVAINISGQTLNMEMLFNDYALARGADGSLNWTTTGNLSDGTKPAWS